MVVHVRHTSVSAMHSEKSEALAHEGFSGREGVRLSCTRIRGACCVVALLWLLTIGRRVASNYKPKAWPILMHLST